jgi:hypothetical protein
MNTRAPSVQEQCRRKVLSELHRGGPNDRKVLFIQGCFSCDLPADVLSFIVVQ